MNSAATTAMFGINPAVATVIAAVVGVGGLIVGALISAWLNRDKDDVDMAAKISEAWDPVFKRYDVDIARLKDRCDECKTELGDTKAELRETKRELRETKAELTQMKGVVRATVRAFDSADPDAVQNAIDKARELA